MKGCGGCSKFVLLQTIKDVTEVIESLECSISYMTEDNEDVDAYDLRRWMESLEEARDGLVAVVEEE